MTLTLLGAMDDCQIMPEQTCQPTIATAADASKKFKEHLSKRCNSP